MNNPLEIQAALTKALSHLTEKLGYDCAQSISIILTPTDTELYFFAVDTNAPDDKWQDYQYLPLPLAFTPEDILAAINTLPSRETRELRALATATSKVVELSSAAQSEAAKAFGAAFAAKLNDLRTMIGGE